MDAPTPQTAPQQPGAPQQPAPQQPQPQQSVPQQPPVPQPQPQQPQQPVPQQPQPTAFGERRRVHHSYIWLGGIGAAFWVLFALAVAGFGVMGELLGDPGVHRATLGVASALLAGGAIAIVAVVVGLAFGLRALAYRYLWYQLDPTELGVFSGVIGKRRTHVPYQKIQSVDLKASLPQRVLGVCNVVIDTAGGASNKAVVIPYLSRQAAQTLRGELYALKNATAAPGEGGLGFAPPTGGPVATAAPGAVQGNVLDLGSEAWEQFGGVFGGTAPRMEAASYEYGLSNKEILLTGMSNSGGVLAGIVGAIVAGIATLAPILASLGANVPDVYDAASEAVVQAVFSNAVQGLLPFLVAGFLVFALVIYAIASAAACVQYGGFRARRRGTRIEVERGLLQHNAVSLDIERVQSVVVRQTFIRRLIGYCEVSLGKVSAAEPGQQESNAKSLSESGFVIHPFVKLEQVDAVLRGMVPEFAQLPAEQQKLAPVALRRGLIRRCVLCGGGFWLAVFAALMQSFSHLALGGAEGYGVLLALDALAFFAYAIAAIVLAFDVAGTVLWFRDSRFGLADSMVSFTNGGLSKATVAIPRTKVQFGATKSNPLQRRAGTATVAATTAAGVGGTQSALVDVTADAADAWLAWVEPRA